MNGWDGVMRTCYNLRRCASHKVKRREKRTADSNHRSSLAPAMAPDHHIIITSLTSAVVGSCRVVHVRVVHVRVALTHTAGAHGRCIDTHRVALTHTPGCIDTHTGLH